MTFLPFRGSREHDSLPQFPETPFIKAKRKRVLGDTTHHDDNVDSCSWSLGGNGGPIMTLEDHSHIHVNHQDRRERLKDTRGFDTRSTPPRG